MGKPVRVQIPPSAPLVSYDINCSFLLIKAVGKGLARKSKLLNDKLSIFSLIIKNAFADNNKMEEELIFLFHYVIHILYDMEKK